MLIKWSNTLNKALLFRETRLFVWKIENFDELQLPQSLIFFAEILHTFTFVLFQ